MDATSWSFSEDRSPMDNRPITYAVLRHYASPEQVIIRCRGASLRDDFLCKRGKLEAYVVTPEMVQGESPTVRVRFDDAQPVRQTWSRSQDYKALFAPDPRAFVAQLLKSREFLIEYPPYEKTPETLQFDVAGLREAPHGDAMDGFLRNLTRQEVGKICGPGNENASNVTLNLQYPPSKEGNIGLNFEFSTYGDDAGDLISLTPIGVSEADKYKLSWYGGSIEKDEVEKQVAFRLVSSSPGLMAQWQASSRPKSAKK